VLLAADVMFGSALGIAIAGATAIAFVAVWAALPLRRRREIVGARKRDAAARRRTAGRT
jgi:hypothetical protein